AGRGRGRGRRVRPGPDLPPVQAGERRRPGADRLAGRPRLPAGRGEPRCRTLPDRVEPAGAPARGLERAQRRARRARAGLRAGRGRRPAVVGGVAGARGRGAGQVRHHPAVPARGGVPGPPARVGAGRRRRRTRRGARRRVVLAVPRGRVGAPDHAERRERDAVRQLARVSRVRAAGGAREEVPRRGAGPLGLLALVAVLVWRRVWAVRYAWHEFVRDAVLVQFVMIVFASSKFYAWYLPMFWPAVVWLPADSRLRRATHAVGLAQMGS